MATVVHCQRVPEDDLNKFKDRCKELDLDHNDMIRELVKAFAENRVTIVPTEPELKRKEIYRDDA